MEEVTPHGGKVYTIRQGHWWIDYNLLSFPTSPPTSLLQDGPMDYSSRLHLRVTSGIVHPLLIVSHLFPASFSLSLNAEH